jgi:hypothetical protein
MPAAIATYPDNAAPDRLNVLLPAIGPDKMTGGPNTVLQVACALADPGQHIRFIACDSTASGGDDWFWRHLESVTGSPRPDGSTMVSAQDQILPVGDRDIFLASFWTSAHQAAILAAQTTSSRFLYLIQDFEPAFYPWSSRYAMALATYDLDFHPIVNQKTLLEYFAVNRIGHFADAVFSNHSTVFEPALDHQVFSPASVPRSDTKRLLIYTRPTNPRNMLGMALEAVNEAFLKGAFTGKWIFTAIGARGSLPKLRLPCGVMVDEAPWADYRSYARLLQTSDVLLAPMLSPHTGYPALEMAACGGYSVTNTFGTKTEERLRAISPNIVPVPPTIPGFVRGLQEACSRSHCSEITELAVAMPRTWPDALQHVCAPRQMLAFHARQDPQRKTLF